MVEKVHMHHGARLQSLEAEPLSVKVPGFPSRSFVCVFPGLEDEPLTLNSSGSLPLISVLTLPFFFRS